MTRLRPVPYEEWDGEVLRPLTGGRTVPPSNALGLLLNHPRLAKAFLPLGAHLLYRSTLPARTRELTILRVAWRHRCRYEWAHHVLIAREAGVTEEEMEEVRQGAGTLLNRAVDELETASRLSDEVYEELAKDMDERQLMDLVFTVGAYRMQAMAYNTFAVELDPGMDDGGMSDRGPAA
ncbi:carboxymuconolactone decarboxylase family protein [Streptomyces sp. IBSBF 2953]|uniref:carboxymuconolactone decarboxylase family protein n=1 Tax=Streptomyces TaxID=1883 RepID=UPI00211A1903|nr:carboxymuconolactone decarboxylase family protein [Streptomyces scabiei]MCQ9179710.1 carboxymuconolactone decarboxylase family protein [Streptomyces hayashii]MDX3113601.1 carboxymuconolactone decarboxylase family protein [Streptomyces scabiei]